MKQFVWLALVMTSFQCPAIADIAPPTTTQTMMQAVCDRKMDLTETPAGVKTQFACSTCPRFTESKGRKEEFVLTSAYDGAFSKPGVSEVIMTFRGCESHASGSGGTVLVRKSGKTWKQVAYLASQSLEDCLSFKTGRETTELLCRKNDMHAGTFSVWFAQVSASEKKGLTESSLLRELEFGGNTAGGELANKKCFELVPETFRISKTNPLKVEILVRGGISDQTSQDPPVCETSVEKNFAFKIELRYNGTRFEPTRASQLAIKSVHDFKKSWSVKQTL